MMAANIGDNFLHIYVVVSWTSPYTRKEGSAWSTSHHEFVLQSQ